MSSKVLVLFAVLCLLGSCWGVEETTQSLTRHENIPMEPLGLSSDPDLVQDSTFWRFWKFWKWGRSMLKKVFKHSSDMAESASGRHRIHEDRDTQRTVTRRESSLITTRKMFDDSDFDMSSIMRAPYSTIQFTNDSVPNEYRAKGSVRKELVTLLFESMLDFIVESWDVIKSEVVQTNLPKYPSETTIVGKKKKKDPERKPSRTRSQQKVRSKLDLADGNQHSDRNFLHLTWWSAPDEKAVIRFKNGNIYEGNISMKSMNGEGRFQWADGTVYLGDFVDNEIRGKGKIQWKDDTWYSGEFLGNLRHGNGLYVDSRQQRCYTGGWYLGCKHGQGAIYFSGDFMNSYSGDWVYNVRHGFGTREYSKFSGYQGEWDHYVREGRGLMIWPNHDFYKGEWKNGVMSGCGFYIWDACYNNSMSLASIIAYRGFWLKGQRHGYGLLNLGLGLGSHYKGDFKENSKHGSGKFVSNNGQIIQHKNLFLGDNLKYECLTISRASIQRGPSKFVLKQNSFSFKICDNTVGFRYHIEDAITNLDREEERNLSIINTFLENNRVYKSDLKGTSSIKINKADEGVCEEMINFEIEALLKALQCYETDLNNIYYKYATICNEEPIHFTPILIRLFLWQFYYDCNLHQKGFTFVQIDNMFARNEDWLARTPHNPFEKVYRWQFLHTMVIISNYLYAKRSMPGPKPETIVAQAFRYFMDNDVLPNIGQCKGYLVQSFGLFVPLKPLYQLYRSLGEPHTVRTFLRAVRYSQHEYMTSPQPEIVVEDEVCLPWGRNCYIFGDDMTFVKSQTEAPGCEESKEYPDLLLFNFGNLSSKAIIKIFANLFPKLCSTNGRHLIVLDLDIEITFFEFFEAFIACTEESIRIKDEEMSWREMFLPEQMSTSILPHKGPISPTLQKH